VCPILVDTATVERVSPEKGGREEMTRCRWGVLLAMAGLLLGAGSAVAQEDTIAAGGVGRAAVDAGQSEEARRLAEIQANRDKTISELMGMWAPHEGAYQLEVALRAASPTQLLQVSQAGSFAEVEKVLLGENARTSLAFPNALGDTTQDYVFTPVTPCRIFDTRNAGGALAADTARDFYVYGTTDISSQGGNPAGCPAPKGEPRAVHINLTVVPVGDQGNVRVYPQNATTPNASVVNFKLGTNIANALTVGTYYAIGPKEIQVYAAVASAHVIADIMGYYYNVGAGTGVGFMARRTSSQVIPSGTKTTVIFNTADYDLGADYSTSTGVFTAPATGRYNLNCHLLFGAVPAGVTRLNIYLQRNGADFAATWGDNPANNAYVPRMISGTWSFTAGDTVTCNAYVSGASVSVFQDSGYSYFSAIQVP
jgi:hypothetical protein